jgi:hypothetical protein
VVCIMSRNAQAYPCFPNSNYLWNQKVTEHVADFWNLSKNLGVHFRLTGVTGQYRKYARLSFETSYAPLGLQQHVISKLGLG